MIDAFGCVRSHDPAQMRLTQDDDMIPALAANRSDQRSAKPFCLLEELTAAVSLGYARQH